MADTTEEAIPWPDALADWLRQIEEHRVEKAAALERGRGPCPGGEDDQALRCSACGDYAEASDGSELGDPCPDATGPEQCRGKLRYRYNPESTTHDFDGGQCWRCHALSSMHDPEGGHPIAIGGDDATAEIPEYMVRMILKDWHACRADAERWRDALKPYADMANWLEGRTGKDEPPYPSLDGYDRYYKGGAPSHGWELAKRAVLPAAPKKRDDV